MHPRALLDSLLAALVATFLIATADASAVVEKIPDSYAQPGELVAIAPGRLLNLRCAGKGEPTIMLESGAVTDSSTWFRLQPILAKSHRVCAYDRAGYGFSTDGPLPRTLDADAADLHALIHQAHLSTPLILVGHSLGSNIARLYAEEFPTDVAGLVLIDPPAQDVAAYSSSWAKVEATLAKQRFAFIRQCADAARKGVLASPPADLKPCLAPPNPMADAKVNAAMANLQTKPAFWRTLLSELQNNEKIFGSPVAANESHGSLPLVVLTADGTYADALPEDRKALEAARSETQSRIAATSTRGKLIDVKNTSHDIQIDQPSVVALAINELAASFLDVKNTLHGK